MAVIAQDAMRFFVLAMGHIEVYLDLIGKPYKKRIDT